MKTVKTILVFISKQIGYIIAVVILVILSILIGLFIAATDSQPQDAIVLAPLLTVPISFVAGIFLSRLFNRKRKP